MSTKTTKNYKNVDDLFVVLAIFVEVSRFDLEQESLTLIEFTWTATIYRHVQGNR